MDAHTLASIVVVHEYDYYHPLNVDRVANGYKLDLTVLLEPGIDVGLELLEGAPSVPGIYHLMKYLDLHVILLPSATAWTNGNQT